MARSRTPNKISREFAVRLGRLKPDQKIRAIVLLNTLDVPPGSRRSREERDEIREQVRELAIPALREVDDILARHQGTRLESGLAALGGVAVEGTPDAIEALAESDRVRAIMEDQPVLPSSRSRRRA